MDINVHVSMEPSEDSGNTHREVESSTWGTFTEKRGNHIRGNIKENEKRANGNRTVLHPHSYVWSHVK